MAGAAKYKILHELGAGGMGKVYKGLLVGQAGFQRPIVIKQLKTQDPHHVKLFVDEARRYAVLDHENIGRIFDFDDVGGELCIILEHIDGWSLIEYLKRHRELKRLPDVDLSVFIASRVCRALQYVYEKAAHRPPRHQPQQHHDDPRGDGEAHRLRHRHPERDPGQQPHRQALVHGARDGGRAAGRPPERHLQPGRGPLRDAHRREALPRPQHRRDPREGDRGRASRPRDRSTPTVPDGCRGHPAQGPPARPRDARSSRRGRWARPASTTSTTRATDPPT